MFHWSQVLCWIWTWAFPFGSSDHISSEKEVSLQDWSWVERGLGSWRFWICNQSSWWYAYHHNRPLLLCHSSSDYPIWSCVLWPGMACFTKSGNFLQIVCFKYALHAENCKFWWPACSHYDNCWFFFFLNRHLKSLFHLLRAMERCGPICIPEFLLLYYCSKSPC